MTVARLILAIATGTLCFSATESTVGHAAKYAQFAADSALASVPLVIGEGNTESGGKLLSQGWTMLFIRYWLDVCLY